MGRKSKKAIVVEGGDEIFCDLEVALEHRERVRRLRLRTETRDGLPPEIVELDALEHLDVSKNSFAAFPGLLGADAHRGVRTLSAAKSCISEVTADLGEFTGVERLDLSWNEFSEFPDEIGQLKRLRVLRAERTPLRALPSSVGTLQQLTSLELAGCELTALPEAIGKLSALQRLEVTDNALTSLPESLGALSELCVLRCAENGLEKLPESVGTLSQLVDVDLSSNDLTSLPPSIGEAWTKLKSLSVANNADLDVDAALAAVGRLSSLESLDASGLPGTKMRLPTGLVELRWRHAGDAAPAPNLFGLSKLERLDLAFGRLSELPAEIADLRQLRHLDLTANELTRIPAQIGRLRQLRQLRLGSNELTSLPESMGDLGRLRRLDLSFNGIWKLPKEWTGLEELRELDLENNQIREHSDVAQAVSGCEKLERVNLVGNPITLDAEACEELRRLRPECRWEFNPGKALHRAYQLARKQIATGQVDEARRNLETITAFEPGADGDDAMEYATHRALNDARAMLDGLGGGGRR